MHPRANVRRGAYKSLARSTSPSRRTEWIVSSERGARSCAVLQDFSCYRSRKEAFQVTRMISTKWTRELSSISFPARQGIEGNSRHSDKHLGNMHHRMPSKTGWPSLNVVIFPPVMHLVLDDPKQ